MSNGTGRETTRLWQLDDMILLVPHYVHPQEGDIEGVVVQAGGIYAVGDRYYHPWGDQFTPYYGTFSLTYNKEHES